MKKFLLGMLIVLGGLFVMSSAASAQTGLIVMHVNQDFTAGGKTLPAGTYKVFEGSTPSGQVLILHGDDGSAFLLPTTRDSASSGQAGATLERVGDVYYLSQIVTPLGVYTFNAPQELTRIAKGKSQDSTAAGGTGK
jgi:hypothetical protein